MPRRLAASLALLAFAICLIAGMQSGNPLATVLWRGIVAMAGTLVISLCVGTMAQRMLEENLARREAELRAQQQEAAATDVAANAAVATAPPRADRRAGAER